MGIYLEWGVGWYYILALLLVTWAGMMFYRKDYSIRQQATVGLFALVFAFVSENIAISTNLWSYTPGNWPLVLWPAYFISGMMVYQFSKLVDKRGK